jgi:hypothetical protein
LSRRAWTPVVAALAAAHALSFLGAGPFDDDFICYRYARNALAGIGLEFNAGERVEGFTVPLWVLLHTAGLALRANPVHVSLVVGVLSVAAAAALLARGWWARFPDARWPVPALLFAAMPPVAWHAVTGLGTTLLAALLAGWFVEWEAARRAGRAPWRAGVLLALACLLRQECALFALPFAALELRGRGRGRMFAVLPLAALLGWTIFRLDYYGALLPNTFAVKKLPFLDDVAYGLRYLRDGTLQTGIGALVLAAPLALRGHATAPTRAACLGLVLHTVYVVHVGGDFMELARFFVPVLPLALFLACAGLRGPGRLRAAAVVAALLALQWTQFGWTYHGRPYRFLDHRWMEERWARVGALLGDVLPPDAQIATSPIGAIGWYSERPIVDILGLTNDATADERPDVEGITLKGHHRYDAEWVLARRPEVVVLGNAVLYDGRLEVNPWERTLVLHPEFQRRYRQVELDVPGDVGHPLRCFLLLDAPLPRGARVVR